MTSDVYPTKNCGLLVCRKFSSSPLFSSEKLKSKFCTHRKIVKGQRLMDRSVVLLYLIIACNWIDVSTADTGNTKR